MSALRWKKRCWIKKIFESGREVMRCSCASKWPVWYHSKWLVVCHSIPSLLSHLCFENVQFYFAKNPARINVFSLIFYVILPTKVRPLNSIDLGVFDDGGYQQNRLGILEYHYNHFWSSQILIFLVFLN